MTLVQISDSGCAVATCSLSNVLKSWQVRDSRCVEIFSTKLTTMNVRALHFCGDSHLVVLCERGENLRKIFVFKLLLR